MAEDFEGASKVQGIHFLVHRDQNLDDRVRSVAVSYCTHLEGCICIELVKRFEVMKKDRTGDVVIVLVMSDGLCLCVCVVFASPHVFKGLPAITPHPDWLTGWGGGRK